MMESKRMGEGSMTLKQMLSESRKLLRETGHYAGLEELKLKEDDPIKYEIVHSRILASLIAGRETVRMVSGSPLVREVAELCIGLYTPEGDNIAQSTGIQVHIRCMGEAIQWMIDHEYEEEVGIRDGDLFCCNDNAIAGMHPADVYDILPIFWEEELVGWVCTVIMEPDIGAVTPGCMPVANVERASDGIRICAEKIGSGGKIRRDFEIRMERTLGLPELFLLDRRGAIAANIRVQDDIKLLINEFGLDYYRRVTRELIEDERRNQIARIKQRTIPGRYRNICSLELYMKDQPVSWLPAKKDTIRLIPLEMEIDPSGRLILDFEGAGEWGWHPFNTTPSGLYGGLSIGLVQTICYDGRANAGSLMSTEVKAPLDSLVNPSHILELPTALIWMPTIHIFGLWAGLMGTAFYLRGFREEAFASLAGGGGFQFGGYNQYGVKCAIMVGPGGAYMGGGARGVSDGVNCGGQVYTPAPDIGNAEVWEMFIPLLIMAQRFDPYSVGYGRYRSGVTIVGTQMIHNSKLLIAAGITTSGDGAILINDGLFGGYPGPRQKNIALRNNNISQLIEQRKPLVHEIGHPARPSYEGRVQGEILVYDHLVEYMMVSNGDIFINMERSPGGVGDPIERNPSLVRTDLENGLATQEIASDIYCVKTSYDDATKEWQVDEAATKRLRQRKRKQRLGKGIPVKQWWQKARDRLLSQSLDPLLQEMYQNSMKMSQPFARELREFWALPEEFNFSKGGKA